MKTRQELPWDLEMAEAYDCSPPELVYKRTTPLVWIFGVLTLIAVGYAVVA